MAEQEPTGGTNGERPADGGGGATGPAVAAADPPWYERRIDQVTANWRQTERNLLAEQEKRVAAETALEAAKKGGLTVPAPAAGTPEFEAAVNARAGAQAATLAFNSKCNRIAADGAEKFPDFDTSVATWKRLGELTIPIVEAADETGHAAEIIYELGKNPAEAERILKLGPVQQIAAVVKFAQKFTGEPSGTTRTRAVSGAPEPIRVAVGGGNAKAVEPTLFDTDKLTTAQWIEQREAEIEAKNAKRRRA